MEPRRRPWIQQVNRDGPSPSPYCGYVQFFADEPETEARDSPDPHWPFGRRLCNVRNAYCMHTYLDLPFPQEDGGITYTYCYGNHEYEVGLYHADLAVLRDRLAHVIAALNRCRLPVLDKNWDPATADVEQ